MRALCVFSLLLFATPASATVTLAVEPMNAEQTAALAEAQALVGSMEAGALRDQAATYIAYRLMMRGDCSGALPMMTRQLKDVADFTAIDGLITGALTGRDPRCLTWVADRVNAVVRTGSLDEEQRAELRVRGRTMYQLSGWLGRAARMPAADLDTLDVVPETLRHRELQLEGLTVVVERSDAPTRLESLLLDRLFYFRGTSLQSRFARALAKSASADPKYLSGSGWMEVALTLFRAGDEQGAEQLLQVANVRSITLAGLRAEAALQDRDYKRAAEIFAANTWGTKSGSLYTFFATKPDALTPFMEGAFDFKPTDELHLVSFSEALDQAGYPASARAAADTALKRFETSRHGSNRKAQVLARIGQYDAARALIGAEGIDPGHYRNAIAAGAALAGNLAEVERTIVEAPPAQRDWILMNTLAVVSPIPSPTRDALAQQLELRATEDTPLSVSADALLAYAKGGLSPRLLMSLLGHLEPGVPSAALAIRAGHLAHRYGHRDTGLAIAAAAQALLPEGPPSDAELVELAELYWKLGSAGEAAATARRVSHPVGKVDAMTRAFNPSKGESRARLSFLRF